MTHQYLSTSKDYYIEIKPDFFFKWLIYKVKHYMLRKAGPDVESILHGQSSLPSANTFCP